MTAQFNKNPRDLHENNRNWQRLGDVLTNLDASQTYADNSNGASNSAENSTLSYAYAASTIIAPARFVAGNAYRLTLRGVYTTENPAAWGRLKVLLGAAVIADTGFYTGFPNGAAVGLAWKSAVEFSFRNAISIEVGGDLLLNGTAAGHTTTLMFDETVVSVNATDGALTATFQWSAVGAANRFTLRSYVLEPL